VSRTPFSDRKWPRAEIKFPEVGTLAIRLVNVPEVGVHGKPKFCRVRFVRQWLNPPF